MRVYISEKLRGAVKQSGMRQHRLAKVVGVDRSTVCCWLNGIARVDDGDARVVAIGALVGVAPEDCFSDDALSQEKQDA